MSSPEAVGTNIVVKEIPKDSVIHVPSPISANNVLVEVVTVGGNVSIGVASGEKVYVKHISDYSKIGEDYHVVSQDDILAIQN